MMSAARIKKLLSMFFMMFCFQYIVIFYFFAQSNVAHQHKLQPRHATTKEVRGPNYHVHKVDPMPVRVREGYESRRLLVESNRPRLVPRREIIDEYRHSPSAQSNLMPVTETERYISLEAETKRGEFPKCGICSLVSNSGQIIYSKLGDKIDEADCVFRLNSAPTVGYELDVGRRTTVRVVSQRGIRELIANESVLLDNHPSLSTVFIHGPEYVFSVGSLPRMIRRMSAKYPRLDFYRPSRLVDSEADAEFEKHAGKSRISSGTEFSTGLYALMIMKDICSQINVYGMTPEDYCRLHPDSSVPYSYYKTPSLPECMMYDYHENIELGGQRLMMERRIFRDWAKTSNIKFYSPSWE